MRTVVKEVFRLARKTKKGDDYTLYCYQLDDGQEVETVSSFNLGDKVEVYYDHKWDKIKMRRGREPLQNI